jgi:hypothetical protein
MVCAMKPTTTRPASLIATAVSSFFDVVMIEPEPRSGPVERTRPKIWHNSEDTAVAFGGVEGFNATVLTAESFVAAEGSLRIEEGRRVITNRLER